MLKIRDLEKQIQLHDQRYYHGMPLITDQEYDGLRLQLKKLHPKSLILNKVGTPVIGDFNKVVHPVKMYSLNDVFSIEEIKAWCAKYPNAEYVAEMKLDGLAIEIEYEDGIFTRASTRGDGEIGDDVTHSVRTIKNVPMVLSNSDTITVRGEVVIPRDKFNKLKDFANPRNAAAGSIRQKDPSVSTERGLAFYAYAMVNHETSHSVALELVKSYGFQTVNQVVCSSISHIIKIFNALGAKRPSLNIDIDGMVLKINSLEKCEELGSKDRYPNWAIACKFEAPSAITTLQGIELDKGRTGVITPVAVLEPVEIAGSVISRANLFNQDEIRRLGIYIGCRVIVKKAGDIIPQIEKVLPTISKKESATPIVYRMHDRCPDCGCELNKDQVNWRCLNTDCRVDRHIIYALSKSCLDVQGVGPKFIKQLVVAGLVNSLLDMFLFAKQKSEFKNKVLTLPGWGKNRMEKLDKQFSDITVTPDRFYKSLGIPKIGRVKSQEIAKIYSHPYDFVLDWDSNKLVLLRDIGNVCYNNLYTWMMLNISFVKSYIKLVTIIKQKTVAQPKTFLFTGKMSMSRGVFEAQVKDKGHMIAKTMSKSVDYLVASDINSKSSKMKKAFDYGTAIITEEQFHIELEAL